MVLQGHTAEVRSVVFSPDDKTLATGSEDEDHPLLEFGNRTNRTHFAMQIFGSLFSLLP